MKNNTWDTDHIRAIAGLPPLTRVVTEAFDDDDEDPDVKTAMADSRQREFERRNKKELAAADAPAKTEEKPTTKAESKPATKAEEKPAAKPVANNRGRKPNADSKAQRALAVLKNMSRGEFLKWAEKELGMGKNYASAFYAKHNPKSSRELKESSKLWMIQHAQIPNYVLTGRAGSGSKVTWGDISTDEPIYYVSESEARNISNYLRDWRGQLHEVVSISMDDVESSMDGEDTAASLCTELVELVRTLSQHCSPEQKAYCDDLIQRATSVCSSDTQM